MKKIGMLHLGITLAIILSLISFIMLWTPRANGAEIERISQQDKRKMVQQRREKILRNGNIDNFYPKKFKVEWFLVNNRAHMGIIFNNGVNRQWRAR